MSIIIEKLENEYYSGDWHDKPLRWAVRGPNIEEQHFSTFKNASLYKKYRKICSNQAEASKMYSKHDN